MFYTKGAVISAVIAYVVLFAWAIVTFLRTRPPGPSMISMDFAWLIPFTWQFWVLTAAIYGVRYIIMGTVQLVR
jgi:hypothetical protein